MVPRWAGRQVGQVVGKEAILHPVHAEIKALAVLGRGQRISAGLLFAVGVLRYGGDELAGEKWKLSSSSITKPKW